jgi:hypothetical protein
MLNDNFEQYIVLLKKTDEKDNGEFSQINAEKKPKEEMGLKAVITS